MRTSFHLVNILGIPVRINYSLFIIFFLVTSALAQYVYPELYPDWSRPLSWLVALCHQIGE